VGLDTLVRETALTSLESVVFLKHVRRETKSKLLVIWDGSPIHRREVMTFMETGRRSLETIEECGDAESQSPLPSPIKGEEVIIKCQTGIVHFNKKNCLRSSGVSSRGLVVLPSLMRGLMLSA
jgi:hypothetical protein